MIDLTNLFYTSLYSDFTSNNIFQLLQNGRKHETGLWEGIGNTAMEILVLVSTTVLVTPASFRPRDITVVDTT